MGDTAAFDQSKDGGVPLMQFGKWEGETFHLDAGYPFSPVQAFALALSTFDVRVHETLKMNY